MTTIEYTYGLVEKVCASRCQTIRTPLIGKFSYMLAPIPLKEVQDVRYWELDMFDQDGCAIGDGHSITGDTLSHLLEHAKKRGVDLEKIAPLEAWDIVGEE